MSERFTVNVSHYDTLTLVKKTNDILNTVAEWQNNMPTHHKI